MMFWNKPKVLTIGDTAVDVFIRLKESSGIRQFYDGDRNELYLDFGKKLPYEFAETVYGTGNAANAAVCSARLGINTYYLTHIGDDELSYRCWQNFRHEKIHNNYIRQHRNKKTGEHFVLWFKQDRTILTKHEQYKYHFPQNIKIPDWIYLSSIGDGSLAYHKEICTWLKKHPKTKLVFQPGTFQIKAGCDTLKDIYQHSEVFICNIEEGEQIIAKNIVTGSGQKPQQVRQLAEKIAELGPKTVVLTDGADGSYTWQNNILYYLPQLPSKPAVERTGAGDAYSSTFMNALILGQSVETAMRWGSINATSVCNFVGSQHGLLSLKEIKKQDKEAPKHWQVTQL